MFPPQHCAIRTPLEYLDSLTQYRESLSTIKAQVASVLVSSGPATAAPSTGASASTGAVPAAPASPAAATTMSPEERKRKQIVASTAVSKKFMVSKKNVVCFVFRHWCKLSSIFYYQEWLVSTGNAKQVLDLIRIDGEKTGISSQNGHS